VAEAFPLDVSFGTLTHATQQRARHVALANLGLRPFSILSVRPAKADSRLDISFDKVCCELCLVFGLCV
jgi:hypothetical protein